MAVNKQAKKIYNILFDGFETSCANVVSSFIENKLLNKYINKNKIPREYKKAIKTYWKKYLNISPRWGWYYGYCNKNLDPRYIPNTLYYSKIDQYFNNRKLGWGFNDKNYYSRIFYGIKQPEILVRKINKLLLDCNYNQISKEEAIQILLKEKEIVCKPSLETGSGRGVNFWNVKDNMDIINEFLVDDQMEDYVVQKIIKQHVRLNEIHASSINTIRIMSLLMKDGVHILSSCLRMGVDGSRVDNVTAGGISCGIKENGYIDKYAYTYFSGERMTSHPQGFVFDGFKVPGYEKAIELVHKAHPMIPHFRLVSWDIAIDENEEPVLIEANMRKGGINLHQFNNGPLFGELTDNILDEVFGKNKNI